MNYLHPECSVDMTKVHLIHTKVLCLNSNNLLDMVHPTWNG